MKGWYWGVGFLFSFTQVLAASSDFCPPFKSPHHEQKRVIDIPRGDVAMLLQELREASPNTILLLADGTYTLQRNQALIVRQPGMSIRSASGNRAATIIEGGYNNITINADDVTVADVTLRNPRFHNIQVRGELGVLRTKIYNVHLVDAGQQFIKVSTGDGTQGLFADDGSVACSLIEYTTYAQGTPGTPPSYTNGIDILAGKGWVVRDNILRRIRSQAGPAGPAILVWKNAMDTVITRNLIIDSWRGIALGLTRANQRSRGGAEVLFDHQNGLVENNLILALHERANAAIENNYALNSRVYHNTVYYADTIDHAVDWSIEYRFPATTAVIKNNLTNRPIISRAPHPGAEATVEGNVTTAIAAWFRDVASGDFHLAANAPAIDAGVDLLESQEDIDGDPRPFGLAPDAGADELIVLSPDDVPSQRLHQDAR